MKITQKIIRNVSLTAHPKGCARDVADQISWVKEACSGELDGYEIMGSGQLPKKVLIIGGSTGYGLASRIVAGFCAGADSIQVSFEREPTEKKTATPGWYNTAAFEKYARQKGLYAESVFGDAFSHEVKDKTLDLVEQNLGTVDLVVYSLASPMRKDPETGETYTSVIKPIGETYRAKTVDVFTGNISEAVVEPADEKQIRETVKVMGGEDWMLWMDALLERGLLSEHAVTTAFSYIGPEITFPVYRAGTIGQAKEHLEKSARSIEKKLSALGGHAYVSVNKALVTRASSVIPVVPLYISILYKVMKSKGLHEGCIEQMYRLWSQRLYTGKDVPVDEAGRIRLDDWEMREDVQKQVEQAWGRITRENLLDLADLEGFRKEYERIHGFGIQSVDYEEDLDPRRID
jgi:enoyl-[acyl-carrier protein] reductase/trans-2-enoyl-CoA reductase (NAD+)